MKSGPRGLEKGLAIQPRASAIGPKSRRDDHLVGDKTRRCTGMIAVDDDTLRCGRSPKPGTASLRRRTAFNRGASAAAGRDGPDERVDSGMPAADHANGLSGMASAPAVPAGGCFQPRPDN
jgi:hypothetical protein